MHLLVGTASLAAVLVPFYILALVAGARPLRKVATKHTGVNLGRTGPILQAAVPPRLEINKMNPSPKVHDLRKILVVHAGGFGAPAPSLGSGR